MHFVIKNEHAFCVNVLSLQSTKLDASIIRLGVIDTWSQVISRLSLHHFGLGLELNSLGLSLILRN